MDLSKIEATGFVPEDQLDALRRYLSTRNGLRTTTPP